MVKTFWVQLQETNRSHFAHAEPRHEFVFQPLLSSGYTEGHLGYFKVSPTDPAEIAYFQEHLGDTFEVSLTPKSVKHMREEEK